MSLTSKPAAEVAAERKAALEQHAKILAALAEFGLSTSDPVGAIAGLIRERELVEATASSYAYRLADHRPGLALARAHETLAELGFADQGIPEVLRLLVSQRDENANERDKARFRRDKALDLAERVAASLDSARSEISRFMRAAGTIADEADS